VVCNVSILYPAVVVRLMRKSVLHNTIYITLDSACRYYAPASQNGAYRVLYKYKRDGLSAPLRIKGNVLLDTMCRVEWKSCRCEEVLVLDGIHNDRMVV